MPSPFWGIYCVHNLYNLNCQIIIFIWKRIRRIQVVKFEISNALASEIYDYLCLLNVRTILGVCLRQQEYNFRELSSFSLAGS